MPNNFPDLYKSIEAAMATYGLISIILGFLFTIAYKKIRESERTKLYNATEADRKVLSTKRDELIAEVRALEEERNAEIERKMNALETKVTIYEATISSLTHRIAATESLETKISEYEHDRLLTTQRLQILEVENNNYGTQIEHFRLRVELIEKENANLRSASALQDSRIAVQNMRIDQLTNELKVHGIPVPAEKDIK